MDGLQIFKIGDVVRSTVFLGLLSSVLVGTEMLSPIQKAELISSDLEDAPLSLVHLTTTILDVSLLNGLAL